MTFFETAFLRGLVEHHQGRVSYRGDNYERDVARIQSLLDDGYIRERRLGRYPGFQITDKGREYLGGSA